MIGKATHVGLRHCFTDGDIGRLRDDVCRAIAWGNYSNQSTLSAPFGATEKPCSIDLTRSARQAGI